MRKLRTHRESFRLTVVFPVTILHRGVETVNINYAIIEPSHYQHRHGGNTITNRETYFFPFSKLY